MEVNAHALTTTCKRLFVSLSLHFLRECLKVSLLLMCWERFSRFNYVVEHADSNQHIEDAFKVHGQKQLPFM